MDLGRSKNGTTRVAATVVLTFLIFTGRSTYAGPILFEHTGATDPTTEGWTAPGGGFTLGPVINDQGSGFDAWSIDGNGRFGLYSQIPTNAQIAAANTQGWQIRSRLRVVDVPDGNDFAIEVGWRNGVKAYSMAFGSTAAGDPTVRLFGRSTITLTGFGSGYHQYDLIFDPNLGSASLFVDGTLQDSGYTGISQNIKQVYFGDGQSSASGTGNYNLYQFSIGQIEIVPEPSTLTLGLLGAAVMSVFGWRRKMRRV